MTDFITTDSTQWNQLDFSKIIDDRKSGGCTKESFDSDVKMYNNALKRLPKLNNTAIMNEIDQWNLDVPSEEYDFGELQGAYSRLVSYRYRLIKMINLTNQHYDIYSNAYKKLGKIAMLLFAGTAKDKEAAAENLVHPFAICMMEPKVLLEYLCDVQEHIDFAAISMARVLREKEALAKINNDYNREGMYNNFMKSTVKEATEEETGGFPHTRKRINTEDSNDD